MKSMIRHVDNGGLLYDALMFCCPGCALMNHNDGLHILPVNAHIKSPSWAWNEDLERPTLTPSILTTTGKDLELRCHSYLVLGEFQYLSDCTHELVNQRVPIPDLPQWVVDEQKINE